MSLLNKFSQILDTNLINIINDIKNCCDENNTISIEMLEKKMKTMITLIKEEVTEVVENKKVNNKKVTKKIAIDNTQPKKPASAFIIWSKVQRPILISQNPELKQSDIMKLLGKEWKNVSSDVKDEYSSIYYDKKEVYLDELKKYNLENNIVEEKKSSKTKLSAFTLFRNERLSELRKTDPTFLIKDVIDNIKLEWKNTNKDEYKSRVNSLNDNNMYKNKKTASKYIIYRNARLAEIRSLSANKIKIKDVEHSIKEEWRKLKKNKEKYCEFLNSVIEDVNEAENKSNEEENDSNYKEDHHQEEDDDDNKQDDYDNNQDYDQDKDNNFQKKYKFNVDYLAKEVEKIYISLYNQDSYPLYLISVGGIRDDLDDKGIKYDDESLDVALDILNDRISKKKVLIRKNKLANTKLCKIDVAAIYYYLNKNFSSSKPINLNKLKKILDTKNFKYDDESITIAMDFFVDPKGNRVNCNDS